mgnify:CR=1 FL=1
MRPKRLGFLAVAMSNELGRAKFDFWFGTYVDMRKWLRVLEHITKHFEQVSH